VGSLATVVSSCGARGCVALWACRGAGWLGPLGGGVVPTVTAHCCCAWPAAGGRLWSPNRVGVATMGGYTPDARAEGLRARGYVAPAHPDCR